MGGWVGVGGQGEAAATNASGAAGGMAVEGYFLLQRLAAFLVTVTRPSLTITLARLREHKNECVCVPSAAT